MKKYTIKSISDEGIYYLVNGWNKCKTFWFDEKSVFQDTELFKVIPDYANDKFEVVEF